MKISIFATTFALATKVFGHGGVYSYEIDGVHYPGYKWFEPSYNQSNLIQRAWYKDPVQDPLSPNITCNYNGEARPGSYHAPILAGSRITANWSNAYAWSDPNLPFYCDPVDLHRPCPPAVPNCIRECTYNYWYHAHGPLMAYLAPCNGDCSTINPADLLWFKIAETGLREGYTLNQAGGWYQSDLGGETGKPRPGWTVTIPASLRAGNYLIRHEILMIELMPPQFYMECAQLRVEGDGTASPSEEYLVKFPGAYKMSDPGIAIAGIVYYPEAKNITNYTIPGPKMWTG